MNTGLPGWAVFLIAWGLASVATAAVWSAVKGVDRRLAPIDLTDLTDDPAESTVDETLTRCERYAVPIPWTTDPRRFTTRELQRINRVQAQDYQDAATIREQQRWGR